MHYEAVSIPALTGFANKDSYEWITLLPRVLFVREAPFGRIALLICSDLLLRENLRQLLIELSVNVILVPAMSWSVGGDFLSAAKELAEYNQAITVVSNACAMPREARSGKRKGKGVKVSFVVVPASPGVWWCSCDTDAGPCDTRKCVGDFVLQLGSWPKGFDKMKMS